MEPMTETQALFVYIVSGAIVVVGFVWLVSRGIKSGKKLPTPKETPYDIQDAPPPDSDAPRH
jgi:hypothetical protein